MIDKELIQAVIFDMDGVIVDSEPLHERSFLEIFEEMGYGERHGMHFPDYYGRSDRALWIDFIEKHRPSQTLEELADWKQAKFLEKIRADEPIFEGLPDLVEKAAARYRTAVASGSYHPVIDAVLELKDLRRFFPVVVSSQDVERGKPAPDIFLRTAGLLEAEPRKCCVIEDSSAGVEAALSAGMQVIAITNTLRSGLLGRAHAVVGDYEAIERLIL